MKLLRAAILAPLLLTLFYGLVYPVITLLVGQACFHWKANGSLFYYQSGDVLGSHIIAQNFTQDKYFQPRPSLAGNGYDPTSSGASNYGPTSQKLHDQLQQRVKAYRSTNDLPSDTPIPADAVTASASGLDPHISVENAHLQAPRVAEAREISLEAVECLIKKHTEWPTLGLFGEKRINVLVLNLALDKPGEE